MADSCTVVIGPSSGTLIFRLRVRFCCRGWLFLGLVVLAAVDGRSGCSGNSKIWLGSGAGSNFLPSLIGGNGLSLAYVGALCCDCSEAILQEKALKLAWLVGVFWGTVLVTCNPGRMPYSTILTRYCPADFPMTGEPGIAMQSAIWAIVS